MSILFSKMVGTLAVIIVIAAFIGGSDLFGKFFGTEEKWKYILIAGLLGGAFGIYGTISGVTLSGSGAVISVRDIGPMIAGFMGGPWGGLLGGLICGFHRYVMGGLTATACVIATCSIGLITGLISLKYHKIIKSSLYALIIGAVMECLHLSIVLIMVKPFETALDIVRQIAFPFIVINAIGFALLISMMTYIERQRDMALMQSKLQSELEVATVIQHSLLPPINENYPGRKEIEVSASMEPAKEVGGDFYDFFFLGPDRMAFLIADVSGKGIPAAMFMATSKLTLQNCLRDFNDLADAVKAANDNLCKGNEAEMFVTAWIGILDLPTGHLEYVCAGHNPPVLITEEGAEFIRSKACFVLAGMEGIKYRKESLDLKHGDKLFMYTDGVTEAENEFHELFTEKRLQTCLTNIKKADPDTIIKRIRSDITSHVHGSEQFDDITMLCIKYN
nr:SpoIIE family protein phosphatase [Clostridia bacterium]